MKKLTAGIFTVLLGLVSADVARAAVVSTEYLDEKLDLVLADKQGNLTAQGPLKIEENVISVDTGAVSENGTNLVTAASIYAALNAAVADLKVDEVTAGDGKYFGAYKQENGKVSMTEKGFETTITEGGSANAPSVNAVKAYVVSEIGNLEGDMSGQLSGVKSDVNGLKTNSATKTELAELADGAVATNTSAIAKLNADATTEGSMAKAIADAQGVLQGNIDLKADQTSLDATDAKVLANETAIANEKSAREAADTQLQANIDLKANAADVYTKTAADALFEKQEIATQKLQEAKKYTDDQLKTLTEDMWGSGEGGEDQGLQGTVAAQGLKIGALEAKVGDISVADRIDALDKVDEVVDKQFVTAVSEENGVSTVSRRALAAADIPVIEIDQVDGLADALEARQVKLSNTDKAIVISEDGVISIATGGIQGSMIADSAINESKLADNAVTQNKIANGAITKDKIASDAVSENAIVDGAVTTDKIGAGAITNEKLGAQAVKGTNIEDNAVGTQQLASDVNSLLTGAIQAPSETNADGTFVLTAKKVTVDGKVTYSYAWEDIAGRSE